LNTYTLQFGYFMPIALVMVRSRIARSSLYVQIEMSTSGCVCISHGISAATVADRDELRDNKIQPYNDDDTNTEGRLERAPTKPCTT
jgi:hypothetical protein